MLIYLWDKLNIRIGVQKYQLKVWIISIFDLNETRRRVK